MVSYPGWEADDVIATLAKQAAERGMEVRIVTSDKDARQLLGPHVQMFNIRKKLFLDEAYLKEDWGVRPDQVIDFQSLVGDSTDNVPGVPLVGPKKAQALLEEFGTLENVLANADKVRGKKLQENLKNFAEQAYLSRRLVTLNTELPLDFDWEAARVSEPDWNRLEELFTELAFKRYAEEARKNKRRVPKTQSKAKTLFREWDVIDTLAGVEELARELEKQQSFCVDLETTDSRCRKARTLSAGRFAGKRAGRFICPWTDRRWKSSSMPRPCSRPSSRCWRTRRSPRSIRTSNTTCWC